jgi:hypothetical protein
LSSDQPDLCFNVRPRPFAIRRQCGHAQTVRKHQASSVGKREPQRLCDRSQLREFDAIGSGERHFLRIVPSAATLDKTSAQFTALIVAPSAIASTTTEEPSSSCSSAITAAAAGLVLAVFCARFRATPSDQLVAERSARVVAEHPPRTLGNDSMPLDLRLREFGGLGHA